MLQSLPRRFAVAMHIGNQSTHAPAEVLRWKAPLASIVNFEPLNCVFAGVSSSCTKPSPK